MATFPSRDVLILDGGTGETLFRNGMPDDRKTWSALAVTDSAYHDMLVQVHREFIDAGADMITVNSYSITPGSGFAIDDIPSLVSSAATLARKAATAAGKGTLVCGSLAPLVESYRPDLVLPHDEGVALYCTIAVALQPQVDVFIAETMSSFEEASQVVDAVKGLERPLIVSWSLRSDGMLRSGESPEDAIHKLLKAAGVESSSEGSPNVQLMAVMFNCCTPEAVSLALTRLKAEPGLHDKLKAQGVRIGAYANRLTAVPDGWTMADSTEAQPMRGDLEPREYWDGFVSKWIAELGVSLVGGCCGVFPEHIRYIHDQVQQQQQSANDKA
jgi:S-methylmethionine-dependent homocysteine/selenocysteine methylase